MSQIDEERILSERDPVREGPEAGHVGARTGSEQAQDESLKLVPVAESIRYRKRAQCAERQVEVLAEQLTEAKSQAAEIAARLDDVRLEQRLMHKLVVAGAVDLETAVLIAKARIEGQEQADLDGCVEQLRKEKQYLFADGPVRGRMTAERTAGAKDRMMSGQTVLERAARRASTSGSRADLQEYLKLRRNFL